MDLNNATPDELRQAYKSSQGRLAPIQQENSRLREDIKAMRAELDELRTMKANSEQAEALSERINNFIDLHPEWDAESLHELANVFGVNAQQAQQGQQAQQAQQAQQGQQESGGTFRDHYLAHNEKLNAFNNMVNENEEFKQWVESNDKYLSAVNGVMQSNNITDLDYYSSVLGNAYNEYESNLNQRYNQNTMTGNITPTNSGVSIRYNDNSSFNQSQIRQQLASIDNKLNSGYLTMLERSTLARKRAELSQLL